jgi:hypothetical protein
MGTPLTEEKFNEYLIMFDARMTAIETRLSRLEVIVKEIKGFQDHESEAIEYELYMILEKYLKIKFPLCDIQKFPMKRIYDQYDKEITELDAAFLINPLILKRDYSRLRLVGVDKRYSNEPSTEKSIFVMAEAKHHITSKKIKQKLEQFHRIRQLFRISQNVTKSDESVYGNAFIKTLTLNKYMLDIDTCYLYFGAAYWEKGLLDKLQQMIKEYKLLSNEFVSAKKETKNSIYRKLCKLESSWFVFHNPTYTDSEIESIQVIDSIYNYIEFIVPSGSRFEVHNVQTEPDGFLHTGGSIRKTRKMHA